MCRLWIFAPSTTTLSRLGNAYKTLPDFPLLFPVVITTVSPFFYLHIFYNTSPAREAILSKPLSLISRGIGPKMRPPFGCFPSTITAAFSSNRMYEPSVLRNDFFCLTTTAFTISCCFTVLRGSAFFTVATIISPMRAYLLLLPPSTLIHWISFASSVVCNF